MGCVQKSPAVQSSSGSPRRDALHKFFKREPGESKLIAFDSGQELNEPGRQLKDYGLGHWSLMTLVPTTGKAYKRVTFGN
ncbi:hypothetical protein LJR029_000704 [Caballeronia sp. LjRoot29]|uniref:hypothetical protein n=1 Tax=Caballeronia sp. LjRoot29 TaxID=3342315 RepID=UPI003ECC5503